MTLQDWGIIVALALSAAGLVWNVFTWIRSQSTRVVVKVSTGPYPIDDNEEDPTYVQVLAVTVVNKGALPIRVLWVSAGPARVVNTMERLKWEGMDELPKTVPPNDHIAAYFDWDDLDRHLGKHRKVRASVALGDKQVIMKYYSDGGLTLFWRRVRRHLPHRKIRIQL
jgi:hypothetical protein